MRLGLGVFLAMAAFYGAAGPVMAKTIVPEGSPVQTLTIRPPAVELNQDDPLKSGGPKKRQQVEEPEADDATAVPRIHRDPETLPKPVARMREQIVDAARGGMVEDLRPVLESNEVPPILSFGDPGDPIDLLKAATGDPDGREILAILIEVMEAGWVHVDAGTPEEMFIWPYFARYPLDRLTNAQYVELFKLLTFHDLQEMKVFGAYNFYRVGIGPDGTWHYFVAGD